MGSIVTEFFKVVFLGIVEGITEWLPISSTGHMLLVNQFLQISGSEGFKEMFFVVIQLGAILAVVLLFWNKMFPFQWSDKNSSFLIKETFLIWIKVVIACVPGAIVTILFDNYIDARFQTPQVIAAALIFYGVAFILIENWNKRRTPAITNIADINYQTAFIIGLFQVLSIVPGTSRSGATIIGALLIGVSRTTAAEFTFFMAVPVMFGLSAVKILKFGLTFSGEELFILVTGMVVAFAVSILVIKFLMSYIKKHDFKVFGWYRIIMGMVVLIYFFLK